MVPRAYRCMYFNGEAQEALFNLATEHDLEASVVQHCLFELVTLLAQRLSQLSDGPSRLELLRPLCSNSFCPLPQLAAPEVGVSGVLPGISTAQPAEHSSGDAKPLPRAPMSVDGGNDASLASDAAALASPSPDFAASALLPVVSSAPMLVDGAQSSSPFPGANAASSHRHVLTAFTASEPVVCQGCSAWIRVSSRFLRCLQDNCSYSLCRSCFDSSAPGFSGPAVPPPPPHAHPRLPRSQPGAELSKQGRQSE